MSVATAMPSLLGQAFEQVQSEVDSVFDAFLPVPDDTRARLIEAMRYAVIGGGKRVRPLLLVATAELFGVNRNAAINAGCAVEAIHAYSLIHGDLPCMDDDEMRHGKPTLHKAFDEATAVLAGDSLHALAFDILTQPDTSTDPFVRAELVATLARASGHDGMAGGQMMDIVSEEQSYDLRQVTRLQQLKTGALLAASVEMGAVQGRVAPEGRTHLRAYARDIGLAFQIADDILDATATATSLGKNPSDADRDKTTYVGVHGLGGAVDCAQKEVARARAALVVLTDRCLRAGRPRESGRGWGGATPSRAPRIACC